MKIIHLVIIKEALLKPGSSRLQVLCSLNCLMGKSTAERRSLITAHKFFKLACKRELRKTNMAQILKQIIIIFIVLFDTDFSVLLSIMHLLCCL